MEEEDITNLFKSRYTNIELCKPNLFNLKIIAKNL